MASAIQRLFLKKSREKERQRERDKPRTTPISNVAQGKGAASQHTPSAGDAFPDTKWGADEESSQDATLGHSAGRSALRRSIQLLSLGGRPAAADNTAFHSGVALGSSISNQLFNQIAFPSPSSPDPSDDVRAPTALHDGLPTRPPHDRSHSRSRPRAVSLDAVRTLGPPQKQEKPTSTHATAAQDLNSRSRSRQRTSKSSSLLDFGTWLPSSLNFGLGGAKSAEPTPSRGRAQSEILGDEDAAARGRTHSSATSLRSARAESLTFVVGTKPSGGSSTMHTASHSQTAFRYNSTPSGQDTTRTTSMGSFSSGRGGDMIRVESRTGPLLPPSTLWSTDADMQSSSSGLFEGVTVAGHGTAATDERKAEDDGDEEDIESNPIYRALVDFVDRGEERQPSAAGSSLQRAHIVLLPSLRALRTFSQDEHSAADSLPAALKCYAYIALHALVPSRLFKDTYVPVQATGCRRMGRGSPDEEERNEEETASISPRSDGQSSKTDPWTAAKLRVSVGADRGTFSITFKDPASTRWGRSGVTRVRRVLSETTVYLPTLDGNAEYRVRIVVLDGLVVPLGDELAPFEFDQVAFPVTASPDFALSPASSSAVDTQWASLPVAEAAHTLSRSPGSAVGSISCSSVRLARTFSARSLASSSHGSHAGDEHPILQHISPVRNLAEDLRILLDACPPAQFAALGLKSALRRAFCVMQNAASQFNSSFVYVSGFEEYNAARIRKGIFLKAWQAFEDARRADEQLHTEHEADESLPHRAKTRVMSVLENITMALCHEKVYMSLSKTKRAEETALDEILRRYGEHEFSLDDFDIGNNPLKRRPDFLDKAIDIITSMPQPDVTLPSPLQYLEEASHGGFEAARLHLRTPLDALHIFKAGLEAIQDAAVAAAASLSSKQHASQTLSPRTDVHVSSYLLSTDELLPLLAYVLVKAEIKELVTLLAYIQLFRMGEDDVPNLRWVSTTLAAAVQYLRSDPLREVLAERPQLAASSLSRSSSLQSARPTSPASLRSADGSGFTHVSQRYFPQRSPKAHSTFFSDERRRSLPLSAAYAGMSLEDALKAQEEARPSSPSSQDFTDKDGFKVPSLPASASSSGTAVRSNGGRSRGSSELQIRPQLIVRHRRRHLLSSGSGASSGSDQPQSSPQESTFRLLRTQSSHGREATSSSFDARRRSIDALNPISWPDEFHEPSSSIFIRSSSISSITQTSIESPKSSGFSRRPASVRSVSSIPDDRPGDGTSPSTGNSTGTGTGSLPRSSTTGRRRKHSHALLLGSNASRGAPMAPVSDPALAAAQAQTMPPDSSDSAVGGVTKSQLLYNMPAPAFLHRVHVPSPVAELSDPFSNMRISR
ncbi:hypothetical protein K437DRAFT_275374 [Tilletiaria anomala UBC 951]|uniref:VPS9 domain-containing protein n=1 Tax=Tilletiaria anomala (strain ATCC 24038 / CBS 436.72 / UBC 951) TaxID=1037660 RepID=A0A066VIW0_TILAU|nr:uncharacterized protein K437DRAFT_275374 [Tilletiaria anomala UBC 951]KDN41682.1 hypothetical protein K437DRAFT_275374 [Tilletiaria anomala UBC 951]